jgi:PAS domain S-box-containing protein
MDRKKRDPVEAALRIRLSEGEKGAETRVEELNLLLLAIREINKVIVREREPRQLLAEACNVLVKTRCYVLAWIGLVAPDSKGVVPAARAGKQADYLDHVSMTWDETPTGMGPTGTAIRSGQPWACQDTATDPLFAPWREMALARGFASVAAVPMIRGNRVLGAITVYSDRVAAFDVEELGLLNELAGDLALTLQSIEHENKHTRAEEALRRSEERFRRIFEESPIGMVTVTSDFRFGTANTAFCKMLGYAEHELAALTFKDVTHPECVAQDVDAVRKVVDGSSSVYRTDKRYVRKDRRTIWGAVTVTAVRDQDGRFLYILAMIEDITERKQTDERLRQQAALLDAANDAIYVRTLDHRVVYWNQGAERLYGWTGAEALGSKITDLGNVDHEAFATAHAALLKQGNWSGELKKTGKAGQERVVFCRWTLLRDEHGQPTEVLAINTDITERRQLEVQFRQAQKMEAFGQLAGGVAHDFNNMLAVMRGNTDLILMDSEKNSPQTNECLKHIAGAAERAANLTRQLLIFSRKQAMQSEPLVLNGLVQNLTKMLKRVIREDIRLECRYAERLAFVRADPGMMEQVLLNLVVNARDAMPEGGQLLITTEGVSFDAASAQKIPGARAGEFVCLSVSDTGTGIAPEHLERIFEPFFTTKEAGKGSGLGLATVHGIVKQHQGWVEVSSRVGEGTTFKIFLPAVPPPAEVAAVPTVEAALRGGSETILLVEDDYSVRMITRRVLETFKYKVYEATCAREAIGVWSQHAGEIALLLTDIVMPEGVTGRDLAEQLRTERPGLKVIFMSGYSAELVGKDTEFFRKTRSYFLHKPCMTATLIQTVRKCLDEKEPGGVCG